MMKPFALSLALLGLFTVAAPPGAQAQLGNSFTADEARNARDKGDVVPLREIFEQLKARYGGYQVDANLYRRGKREVYEIDWMTGKGERVRVTVDAKSGRELS